MQQHGLDIIRRFKTAMLQVNIYINISRWRIATGALPTNNQYYKHLQYEESQ